MWDCHIICEIVTYYVTFMWHFVLFPSTYREGILKQVNFRSWSMELWKMNGLHILITWSLIALFVVYGSLNPRLNQTRTLKTKNFCFPDFTKIEDQHFLLGLKKNININKRFLKSIKPVVKTITVPNFY
jgi:hypothetical protein